MSLRSGARAEQAVAPDGRLRRRHVNGRTLAGRSRMDHTDMTTPTPPEALVWHDVIRRRPYMFLGDGGTLGTLYLLSNLLECPLQPTSIVVTLEDGGIRIQARCVPPSVLPRESGQPPYLVEVCTRINSPIDSPASVAPMESFDADCEPPAFKRLAIAPPYLAIANALSECFRIESITNGVATRACFERGVLRSGLLETISKVGPGGFDHVARRNGPQKEARPAADDLAHP